MEETNPKKKKDEPEHEHGNRQALGLSLGLCFGVAFGVALDNLALGIALGLALGLCFGSRQPRKKEPKPGDDSDQTP